MALALLDILGIDASAARLRLDTGTNRYYQLKIGVSTTTRSGFDWVDEVVYQTPMAVNPAGGGLLNTATELTVPIRGLRRAGRGLPPPRLFAQLFSFKTPDGRALGFSQVLPLDRAMTMLGSSYLDPSSATTLTVTDGAPALRAPRAVPCRTAEQFSEPRIDDLLAQIVRVAAPVVLQLLGNQSATTVAGASGSGATTQAAGSAGGALGPLIQAIVSVLPGLVGQLGGGQVSHAQSTLLSPHAGARVNRFTTRQPLSRPMIFGIDDAIIGSVIGQVAGPLLNVLPQLLNASNQQRVQLEQNRNHLVSDLVGQVERRMLLQQVLQAQQQAPPSQAADLQRLADLVQQAGAGQSNGAGSAPAASPPAPTAAASSLSVAPVSSRAVVSFITAPALTFPGGDAVLFARGRDTTLQIKLAVGDPVPRAPLPRAIARVLIKDPQDQRVLAEKVVKQRDLQPNGTVAVPFTADQLAAVPTGRPVSLLAEIRWRVPGGAERKALGAQDAVFVERLFVKSRGANAGPEHELTDMGRYRPFWNKVWESPTVADGKTLWGLNVTMKYTVLLTPAEHSNGLMQTRISSAPDGTTDELRMQTSGRMKAGMECSVDELAKLSSLWDSEPLLDADHLAAFRSAGFATQNAGEAVTALRLDGPRDERGLVWVVPVMQLVDYTLGAVKTVDDHGQVTAVEDEHAHFPLPVAIRILELRSGGIGDASSGGDEPEYHFDGYRTDHSEKVALIPHG
jgi:hypothetical protein